MSALIQGGESLEQAMSLFSRNLRSQDGCQSRANSVLTGSRRSRQLGFSLLEIMVVVIITLILSLIAIPSVWTITRSYRISGDTFGFGTLTTGPTTATSSIAQAPACKVGVAGASAGTSTANTACVEFNSRGYPVDSTNTIVASDAVYITNGATFSAIAVSISGQPATYSYAGSAWSQF